MRDFLVNHSEENNISFHMPGHKGPGIYKKYGYKDFLDNMMDCDITEIPGADNLHQPEGIIKNIQETYRELYDAEESHILVNGTSCGIIAAVLACTEPGGSLILSRGCHRSVYSGLELGQITPCYISPEITEEGIMGAVDSEKVKTALEENPEAAAVILPSPNYYGICSDIKAIAEEVHKKGKILIVDQAHGAHLHLFHRFTDGRAGRMQMPESAEMQGADIVINSTHKTLATFTQTAVLNVMTERPDNFRLTRYLHMVQSTSPSYLLMASHDINGKIIKEHGPEIFRSWLSDLQWFYSEMEKDNNGSITLWDNLDFTKINIDASVYGMTGNQMEEYLMKKGIVPEMVTDNLVVAMSGIGNVREDYRKLAGVLRGLRPVAGFRLTGGEKYPVAEVCEHGNTVKEIKLSESEGYVCADLLIPYPPGIPVLCPGEKITGEIKEYIEKLSLGGRQILGLSEDRRIHIYEK